MSSLCWLQHAKIVCQYSLSVARYASSETYVVEYGYI